MLPEKRKKQIKTELQKELDEKNVFKKARDIKEKRNQEEQQRLLNMSAEERRAEFVQKHNEEMHKSAKERQRIETEKERQKQLSSERLQKALQYSGGWNNYDSLPIQKALEFGVPNLKCFVYKLTVGGSDYIGFTTQDPSKRLDQHLDSARENSKQKVHVELRKFGFIYDFEIISAHENEVLGLVAEISNIKKYSPELNTSIGGEGNTYKVFEKASLLSEVIFFVAKNVNKITQG